MARRAARGSDRSQSTVLCKGAADMRLIAFSPASTGAVSIPVIASEARQPRATCSRLLRFARNDSKLPVARSLAAVPAAAARTEILYTKSIAGLYTDGAAGAAKLAKSCER